MFFKPIMLVRLLSEVAGTAILFSVGCMGCIAAGPDNILQSSLHIGLVTMIIIHCFGSISGAHVNPCITLACLIMQHIPLATALVHVVGQVIGAFLGAFILLLMLPSANIGACIPASKDLSNGQLLGMEFLLTSILILGWATIWQNQNLRVSDGIGLKMGLYVTALTMAGTAFSGAGMNPLRTLLPIAVINNEFNAVTLSYLGGQLLASTVVPLLWKRVLMGSLAGQTRNSGDSYGDRAYRSRR